MTHVHDRLRAASLLLAVSLQAASWQMASVQTACASEPELEASASTLLLRYCAECHGSQLAEGRIDLESLTAAPDFNRRFKDWERVSDMLHRGQMPPAEMPQPSPAERRMIVKAVNAARDRLIDQHAGHPGPIVLRRLTSAEYAYTIKDLTGLQLDLAEGFVSDAVGGEGFTNVGGAQFIQEATLERYLEFAKRVASHAVVGAGRLEFFADPELTGRELSAIMRIQDIYRAHGFRTAAGEGAEPFGLERYPQALLVAWKYRYRIELGRAEVSLAELAVEHDQSVRFCQHLWDVLQLRATPYPLSLIVSRWRSLPEPAATSLEQVQNECDRLYVTLRDWQSTLAAAAGDEEEASVLTAGEVHVDSRHSFQADIDWPDDAREAQFELSVKTASKRDATDALVVWRNPRLQFRRADRTRTDEIPLRSVVAPRTAADLNFGQHPRGANIDEQDFVLPGGVTARITLQLPQHVRGGQFFVDVELDTTSGSDDVVRCRISDGEVEGETAAEVGATSTLLADPSSPTLATWRSGVAQFARMLPEVSHREPAPSDRDPIPAPFDNTYNKPERNHFHYAIKYHRDDAFFVEHIADDQTRQQLDQAWTDLLTSFDYHSAYERFVIQKFGLRKDDRLAPDPGPTNETRTSDSAHGYLRQLRTQQAVMNQTLEDAEAGHLEDALRFAQRAWRRPLTAAEQSRLRRFYQTLRRKPSAPDAQTEPPNAETLSLQTLSSQTLSPQTLSHTQAMRALLTRILLAPSFLYRVEPVTDASSPAGIVPLSNTELASRLSYFLWSSGPDESLREAAASGRLEDPQQLAETARRMLKDPKARRLATEFFGQWLGFYRFDQYRGIDTQRFPEFTDPLKLAMYEEAIQFFGHIIRADRPVDEILFADYTFLDQRLANHYGVARDRWPSGGNDRELVKIAHLRPDRRQGLTGLGAVLTVTSAPLRTSPVKRGDWLLRRILGTAVPPPPADAGSIAADDASTDGRTVRQRLQAHRREASCVQCHSRIDALGFALENYDPIGRWRETYRDGQPIDTAGTLHDGTEIGGLSDLHRYLHQQRHRFHRTLSSKLLGYALGRVELASDQPLLERMEESIAADGRFSLLVTAIVTSQQFRYRQIDQVSQ